MILLPLNFRFIRKSKYKKFDTSKAKYFFNKKYKLYKVSKNRIIKRGKRRSKDIQSLYPSYWKQLRRVSRKIGYRNNKPLNFLTNSRKNISFKKIKVLNNPFDIKSKWHYEYKILGKQKINFFFPKNEFIFPGDPSLENVIIKKNSAYRFFLRYKKRRRKNFKRLGRILKSLNKTIDTKKKFSITTLYPSNNFLITKKSDIYSSLNKINLLKRVNTFKKKIKNSKKKLHIHIKSTISNTWIVVRDSNKILNANSAGSLGFKKKNKRYIRARQSLGKKLHYYVTKQLKTGKYKIVQFYINSNKKTVYPIVKFYKKYLKIFKERLAQKNKQMRRLLKQIISLQSSKKRIKKQRRRFYIRRKKKKTMRYFLRRVKRFKIRSLQTFMLYQSSFPHNGCKGLKKTNRRKK